MTALGVLSSTKCLPRWATSRTPGRESFGPRIADKARRLGLPFMPWQDLVAEVGGELVGDLPAYREIVVKVPRQSGKTTIVFAWEVDRGLSWGSPQRIAYTAQTGLEGRKKLLQDQVPLLRRSPLDSLVERVYQAQGHEAILFRTGSRIDALPTTPDAGHGRTFDLAVLDEVWADVDDRREQALSPAMITRRDAQILITSTAGTGASTYLLRKVAAGRAAVEAGRNTGTAYFEWSAPDDADADDPKVWRATMPALGFTVSEDTVRSERGRMKDAEFRRAYLNQWTAGDNRAIPAELWDAVQDLSASPAGQVSVGVDVALDRGSAAVAVADTAGVCEIVEHRAGTDWLEARVVEIALRWSAPVAVDLYGPSGSFADRLETLGVKVVRYQSLPYRHACARLWDALMDRRVTIRRHQGLDAAAAAVQKRPTGDGWVWQRGVEDISPLVALTVAFDSATSAAAAPLTQIW